MKNLMKFKPLLFLALSVIFLISLTGQANADILTYNLDYTFSGTNPAGLPPWTTATFTDLSGGSVQLTMSNSNLVDPEFVSNWLFNFNDSLNVANLTFTPVNNTASVPIISTGLNGYKADGDGYFDIKFAFPTANTDNRFIGGETVTYNISYTSPITISEFNFLSYDGGGAGQYKTGAHIQGIDPNDSTVSGWIGTTTATVVPEPISSTLFIVGGAVLGFRRLRKMKKA